MYTPNEYLEFAIIYLLAIFIVVYAWRNLPPGKIRWLFITSFLLMTVYKLYDPNSDWRMLLWDRHFPVYVGEIIFYFFIVTFSKRFIEIEDAPTKPRPIVLRQNLLILLPMILLASGVTWEQYVTDMGLPHIFTLPIFVLVVSLVRLRLTVYESKYIRIVNLFTFAIAGWILIHVSEFIGESQGLFNPLLADIMPHIEFFWYVVGALLFFYAIKIFKDTDHAAA